MKKARKIISMIVMVCFCLTLVPMGAFATDADNSALPFDDVQTTDWFYEPVTYVYDNGLMGGTGDQIFAPQTPLSRGMLVTILHRMEGVPAAAEAGFSDVAADKWYAAGINWAASENVIGGYEDNTFRPDRPITREEMASILYRYSEYKGYDVSAIGELNIFEDGNVVSDWASDVMRWAVGAGLLAGRDQNKLEPQGQTTRAEAATILMRYCENVVGTEAETPNDEPSTEPDSPSTTPSNPDTNTPSTDPTPSIPSDEQEPSQPSEEDTPGEITYKAPTSDHIQTSDIENNEVISGEKYVDNQLVVLAKEGVTKEELSLVLEQFSATIIGEIETVGLYQIEFLSSKPLRDLCQIIEQLEELSQVEDAYLNTIEETEADTIPYFPSDNWNTGNDNEDWDELCPKGNNWGVEAINAPSAWKMLIDQYGSVEAVPSVRVGVIDGYIDKEHPDLKDNVNAVYWYKSGWKSYKKNQTDNTAMEYASKAKTYDKFTDIVHGTHVMGTIGAVFDNNTGISGVAINPELYGASVQDVDNVFDREYWSVFGKATALANLIEDSQCKVINRSIGYKSTPEKAKKSAQKTSEKICDVLKRYIRSNHDFLIVSSAGNTAGRDASINSPYNYIEDETVKSRIIVVGSTYIKDAVGSDDSDGSTAFYLPEQSSGSRVDVLAPGVNVFSTVSANPQTFENSEKTNTYYTANSYYMTMTGTSMAAPHVSGVAALVWAANPNLSGDQVKRIITKSAIIPVMENTSDVYSVNMVDAAYAVSLARDLDYTITGTCGDNLLWSLNPEGTLEIKGSGAMAWDQKYAPWYRYRMGITKIVVGDGVTTIKENAFSEHSNVTDVELGKDVAQIGEKAFYEMSKLKSITLPEGIETIEEQSIGFKETGIIDGFIIYGYAGSAEESYVEEVNKAAEQEGLSARLKFVDISPSGELNPPNEPDNPSAGDLVFAGGSGTAEDPYQVATAEQLNAVRKDLDAHYVQTQDIDLSSYDNWEPIGTVNGIGNPDGPGFTGVYDGNGKTISNLTIHQSDDMLDASIAVGLFGVSSGELKNINLQNVNMDVVLDEVLTEDLNIGGIVGIYLGATSVSNCKVMNGEISAKINTVKRRNYLRVHCGGVVGDFQGGTNAYKKTGGISRCVNNVDINIEEKDSSSIAVYCGGISGIGKGPIECCVNYGNLQIMPVNNLQIYSGNIRAGGILGEGPYASFSNCINYGTIKAYRAVSEKNIPSPSQGHTACAVGGIIGMAQLLQTQDEQDCYNLFNVADKLEGKTISEFSDGIKHEYEGCVGRIVGFNNSNRYNYSEVYSIQTMLNGAQDLKHYNSEHGKFLSQDQMAVKMQPILEALNLDQTV